MQRARTIANKCIGFLPRATNPLLLLLLTSGVLAAVEQKDWKDIAAVSHRDKISQIHITNLLLSNNIATWEGSSFGHFFVPPPKAALASRILHSDAQMHGYYIWFETNDFLSSAKPEKLISRRPFSLVLKQKKYGADTALGRFLRSKDISELTIKYPVIGSLWVHERQYLATPKKFITGYDVEIVLQKSLREKSDNYVGEYQVYDGGNQVAFIFAREEITLDNEKTKRER